MATENFSKKLIESFFGNIATFALNLLFPFVATRLYGSDILGKYTYGYSIVMMTIFLATLGLGTGLLYFIPREGNKYITSSFVLNFFASIVISSVLFVFIKDSTVRAMLPLIWLLSAEQLFFTIYRAKHSIKEYFLINILCGLCLKIILTVVLFKIFGVNSVNIIIATYISVILSLTFYSFKQRKMFGKFVISKSVIKYSLPLIIGTMMSVLISQIDVIMIGNMISKQEVAVYNVAAKIATFPSILLVVLNTVFPPIVAKLYHDGELDKLRKMYKLSARTLAALSSIIIILMVIFRENLLGYYGPEFLRGQYVIVFRGIGQLINASVGSVWYIVCMTGRPKVNMAGKVSAGVINTVLNILLIPVWGITGAAIASMISVGFVNILGYSIVSRILKVKVYGVV
ncbi:flippase [Oceanirhabdus sp. W0125-5]|uniref:flippase n=1 Tax=Oceanirhabdus sp. W0125-5 TaxID=2999116 RepID=UPI0022F2A50E|nr:flippase [Oceanirhabdus sp. W0125-5]WBW99092.1 flippase [Oceanirhabdus sp. W0125-5]